MVNKDERENDQEDNRSYVEQLEKQIEDLHKANEEYIRLKNVDKFAATGRMARTVAHEIRNPLTNISLALEQLNAELPHNDDITLLVEMINRNTLRINQLITDLLTSTKFAQLNFSDASINEILDESLVYVKHFADHKNVVIEEDFAEPLPKLMVDVELLKTAFDNLLTHAIESVQPTEGRIMVTTASENNKCVITIKNNGIAISKEKVERIFEPYVIGKQSSGLALTHAQNIILNHGGNIYVESEQGKGTTFTIILEFA